MKFTRKDFKAWLESQRGKNVGIAGAPEVCPLANFYRTLFEVDEIEVSDTLWWWKGKRLYIKELPRWAGSFIDKIDTENYAESVSAEAALKVLETA